MRVSASYIGKFTRRSRPLREYAANVDRILTGRPYRKGKISGFRGIHRALADAKTAGGAVTLTIVENWPEQADRDRREAELIAQRRAEAEAGGLPLLNGTPPPKRSKA